ncbi:MAG: aminodeoxychorismate/anthranilate synthase component II [Pseudomonadota bacterium]|jgi:anthranilate synthase component 2|nr:aminodeoxychorismate/anthranilate synthase component II [Pseudomonadota bacterium]
MTRVLVIDNYDSFTWNLVHLIGPLVSRVDVVRNDATTAEAVLADRPDAVVLSPGPCTPNEAGICLDLVEKAGAEIPIFGVCLGLQTIGQAFGGSVIRAPSPMHGKVSEVRHRGQAVFRGINGPLKATRYHSLVVERDSCPADLEVTAETRDGLVMGLSHRSLPIHGVQFHPESILSEHGATIMRNFFDLASAWNAQKRDNAPAAVH